MIVQTASDGESHFVMTMAQHTALSAQFAAHFGNEQFSGVEPREQMLHVIKHHDAGWRQLDAAALRDPGTGLPYNLVQTPFEHIVATSSASPDFNSEAHPYCELISSMHSWGLYNGRYGMSDKVLLDSLADDNRAAADTMLSNEIARQDELKEKLGADPSTAAWIDENHLFQNYKQLQFFDTLALYFNCVHESERQEACFSHVPMSASEDTNVDIWPTADGDYALSPYPFDRDGIVLSFSGRYLTPKADGTDVKGALKKSATKKQRIRLVEAS